jgi:serine-type D-Ala-D-Ala carboxypeptidase/endopeptidase
MSTINRRDAVLALVSTATAAALSSACSTYLPPAHSVLATQRGFSDKDLRRLLVRRIDEQRQSVGMALGVVESSSRHVVVHGALGQDRRTVDADTLFRLASLTKIFTALLLGEAIRRGEVTLTDFAADHLPRDIELPERNGRKITLLELATHTSSLPMQPSDFPREDQLDRRARYSVKELYANLATLKLDHDIGSEWRYSDLGMALLARALAHRAGMSYESLLKKRLTGPLGMESTVMSVAASQAQRCAAGHDSRLRPIATAAEPALDGANGLQSTARDLMKLLGAFMGYARTPLQAAMAELLRHRRRVPAFSGSQALGLQLWGDELNTIIGHDGTSVDFASSMLWRPGGFGVVVLSNSGLPVGDISRHIIDPRRPLASPIRSNEQDAAAIERYVGRYRESTMGVVFVVTREGNSLWFQAVGQTPKSELAALDAPNQFSIPRIGARVTFQTANGSASAVRVSFAGRTYSGLRIQD